jgi:hypothetical protein
VSDFTKPNTSNIWKKVLTTTSISSLNKENLNKELQKIDSKLKQIDKVIDTQVNVDDIQKLNNDLKPHNIIITNTQICFYIENQDVGFDLKSRPKFNFFKMLNNFMKSDRNSNLDEKITKIYTIIDSNISNTEELNASLKDFNISIIDNEQICIDV